MALSKNLKDEILKLRSQGMSGLKIAETLGCNQSNVYYHISPNNKRKRRINHIKNKRPHPYAMKTNRFKNRAINQNWKQLLCSKVRGFCMTKLERKEQTKNLHPKPNVTFSYQDVIDKFGETPKCYITGESINIYEPKTYQFDHIIPVSRGGSNTLDNLGICTTAANRVKIDMTPEELYSLCRQIISYQDSLKN